MVFSFSTKRTNTISQTMTTPSAISPAAKKPQSCETNLTTRMKRSTVFRPGPAPLPKRNGGRASPRERRPPVRGPSLLDRERLVDQLLAVRDVLGELGVGTLLRHGDPLVEFGLGEALDLDAVVLVRLDRGGIHRFRLVLVVLL